jgi:hypothetical protein
MSHEESPRYSTNFALLPSSTRIRGNERRPKKHSLKDSVTTSWDKPTTDSSVLLLLGADELATPWAKNDAIGCRFSDFAAVCRQLCGRRKIASPCPCGPPFLEYSACSVIDF